MGRIVSQRTLLFVLFLLHDCNDYEAMQTILELLLLSKLSLACRDPAKKMWSMSMFRTLQRQKTKRRRRTNLERKRSWFSLHVIV